MMLSKAPLSTCLPSRFGTVICRIGVVAVLAFVVGCAQQPDRTASPTTAPTSSPWALPTSTMRWNEYACDLIARNQVGQFGSSRTLAYVNLAINNAIVSARQQGRKPDGATSREARSPRTD